MLALVPDPAGAAHTVARYRVALPIHARFVAFFRLGDSGKSKEQPEHGEKEQCLEHRAPATNLHQPAGQAPAAASITAGPPPYRPVHSPNVYCLKQVRATSPLLVVSGCDRLGFQALW